MRMRGRGRRWLEGEGSFSQVQRKKREKKERKKREMVNFLFFFCY